MESSNRKLDRFEEAQVKIERCKEILEDIMESSADIYVLRKAEQALQVLGGREKVSKLLQEVKERVSKLVDFEEAPGSAMYYMRKDHIVWLISQAEKAEHLENSIKETLETLKRGGPGTRSQVQALLEKALEGKENE